MPFVIGTAGHVDHGKSSLVQALTGIDPDRLAEEKAREMTIDLGFAWLTLPGGGAVGIIDVPGHRDFIENMLAGVGGIDLALFVVAADEGIMPQTREHLAILDLLEVQSGVVALTKIDLATDPEWLDLVMLDLERAFHGTFLEKAPIVQVSARTGSGLPVLIAALEGALAGCTPRPDRGRPRLPIDRVFTISGFGTVVTGTLTHGSLQVGDEVEIQPGGRRARIRGLQNHRESVANLPPGSRAAVNLSGITTADIRRGDVLAAPGILRASALVDVYFRHLPDTGRPLRHNSTVKLFSGAAEVGATVRLLGHEELLPGEHGWLQLRLAQPLALDRGDRFILRYPSPAQTLGGGLVLDPHPAHRWRRFRPDVMERLRTLLEGTPEDRLLQALEAQPAMTQEQLAAAAGLDASSFQEAIHLLDTRHEVVRLSEGWLMSRSVWNRLTDRIRRELAEFHARYPLRQGMPREALRSRTDLEARLFNRVIDFAARDGLIESSGLLVRLPGYRVVLSPDQHAAVNALLAAFRRNPALPPSVKESAGIVGEEVLQALLDQAELIQIGPDVLLLAETYREWLAGIEAFIRREGSITVAQARDLLGTSRKYSLALLEHLDASGFTRRDGDTRTLKRREP